jgi:peroxiredoxin
VRNYTMKQTAWRFLLILFCGSAAINVWLVQVIAAGRRLSPPKAGAQFPTVELADTTGRKVSLTYEAASQPTIIYWFGPHCVWCRRNEANLAAVARAAAGKFRLISIANAEVGIHEYLADSTHDLPVYTDPTGQARGVYGLGSTPMTLVVGADGKLIKRWSGAYQGETARQVETFFEVQLPGIREDTAPLGSCQVSADARSVAPGAGQTVR